MRFHNSVNTRVLQQPTPLQQPVYTQGGILIHFGHQTNLHDDNQNITLTLEHGMEVGLRLTSSIELYSILLAVKLLNRAIMSGNIYTDYAEAYEYRLRIHSEIGEGKPTCIYMKQ